MSSNRQSGFTVLELIVSIVFLIVIGTIFFVQKRDLEVQARDTQRKTSINAMYYALEDVFYAANKFYPEKITSDQLRGIDPNQLKDPVGVAIGEQKSQYRYVPRDCTNGQCKGYTLSADMEHEETFTHNNRSH